MHKNRNQGKINPFFNKFDYFFSPFDLEPEERSKRLTTGFAAICTIPFIFLFASIQFVAHLYMFGSFLLCLGILITGTFFIGRKTVKVALIYYINMAAVGLLFLYMIGTSEMYPNRLLWIYIFPLEAYYMLGKRQGTLFNFIFLIATAFLLFFPNISGVRVYPDIIVKVEFLISFFLVSLISYTFEDIKYEYYKGMRLRQMDLEDEKEKLSEANKRLATAEKELSVINNELEKRIEQRTMELLKVNNQLKDSEKKYRTLFEDSLEAMSLTQNSMIVDVNPAWLRLHGYSDPSEAIGMDIINVIHPDYHHYMKEHREKEPRHRKNQLHLQKDLRSDGALIDVEVHTSTIEIEGQFMRLTTVRDITERLKVEKLRRDLEERLRRAEKMEAIGVLAGGVAHDLNNILSGLVGYPDLLLMDLPEDSPLRKSVLIIQKSGQKAAAIVQDLLTLARRGVQSREIVNLNQIISDSMGSPEIMKTRAFHEYVHIETHIEEDLLNILGSPTHIAKAFVNLVSNAAEAMPNGGTLRIQTENRYVDRPITGYDHVDEGNYAVLIVSDEGIGISTDDIKKIFEPFFTKKIMGRSGTGLGMTVVWSTVKDHHGYIDVESEEGKGTTFTLYFPATEEKMTNDTFQVSLKDHMGRGESVLVIDDVEEQREIAYNILTRLGYSVYCVSSGQEAIDYLKQYHVDILILDMIMDPGIDGLDTYKQILKIHPNQKAIIASGFSETTRVKETMSLGAGQYIRKPYTLEKIGMAVRKELDKT